jgi:hypothetical protein
MGDYNNIINIIFKYVFSLYLYDFTYFGFHFIRFHIKVQNSTKFMTYFMYCAWDTFCQQFIHPEDSAVEKAETRSTK